MMTGGSFRQKKTEKNCTLFEKNRLSDLKKTKSAIMLSCGYWLIAEKMSVIMYPQ